MFSRCCGTSSTLGVREDAHANEREDGGHARREARERQSAQPSSPTVNGSSPPPPSSLSSSSSSQSSRSSPRQSVKGQGASDATEAAKNAHAINMTGVSAAGIRQFLDDVKAAHPDTYETLTTKEVCDLLVVPRTKEDRCAYVDVMDKEHLGRATVFVSHAWRYKLVDVLGTLLEFAEDQEKEGQADNLFFWFDLFVNKQHQDITANLPQDWWSTTFKESIAQIGRVLLVLTPWHDPVPLTRAWCLWEIFCSASQANVELTIRLPNAQRNALRRAVMDKDGAVTTTMVRVQAERAEAWDPKDKAMIFDAIKAGVGFARLNKMVKDQMRAWCLDQVEAFVRDAEEEVKGMSSMVPFATLCECVGAVKWEFGEQARAIEHFHRALDIVVEELGENHPYTAALYQDIGVAYNYKCDYERALEHFNKSIEIKRVIFGEDTASMVTTYHNIGAMYFDKGDYDRAREYIVKAVEIMKQHHGEDNPAVAPLYTSLGAIYGKEGKYEEALEALNMSLQRKLKMLGEKHPATGATYHELAEVYGSKGEHDRALEYHRRALEVTQDAMGEIHTATGNMYNCLGKGHLNRGDTDSALECQQKALDIHMSAVGEMNQDTGAAYHDLGRVYEAKSQRDKALECYRKAAEIRKETLPANHPTAQLSQEAVARLA